LIVPASDLPKLTSDGVYIDTMHGKQKLPMPPSPHASVFHNLQHPLL
jgi:hypothetical protein